MYLSNVNRTENCWNRFGIQCAVWDVFMYFYFLSLFLMKPTTESPWISKLATTKNIEPMKYPREKILDPRHTHKKKFWTHEKKFWTHLIPTRKSFGPTKYQREKSLDPRNTLEKKLDGTMARWRNGTRPKRPTMARDPRNLVHLF